MGCPPGGKLTWPRRRAATLGVAVVIGGLLCGVVLLLRPFSGPLILAAVFVSVFYPLYQRLSLWLRNRPAASLLSCLFICLIIIAPLLLLAVFLAKESVEAFALFQAMLQSPDFESSLRARQLQLFSDVSNAGRFINLDVVNLRGMLLDVVKRLSEWAVSASAALVTGLTGFLFHSFIMVVTMYFFFLDGEYMLGLLKRLNPVPEPYTELILRRFREVSTAMFYGSLLTAIAQGGLGTLIFFLLDLPSPTLWGAAMTIASFIPLVGTGLIWIPMAIYLCCAGRATQGIVLFVLGAGVISTVDNIIRLLVVKERTKIPTLLVFLSILGGLRAFGFIGVVVGPLIAAMVQTLLTSAPIERRRVVQ